MIPWSPLAKGRLARKPSKDQNETLRAQTDAIGRRFYSDEDLTIAQRVSDVAEARGLPMAQVALAWILSKPASQPQLLAQPSLITWMMPLQLFQSNSRLAGKLHAILQRSYTKGRDIYDLLWYLSDPAWPTPNLVLLNNALAQTGWQGGTLTEENRRQQVRERLRLLGWNAILTDVRPFVEPGFDLSLLTLANLERVLGEQGKFSDSRTIF